MNNNKSFFYQERGFTLVEMMIAIAIIGVLASITVPNFKKYQAKSKTVEAKMQLASIYTAQASFYQLFDMYSNCLDYMGFNPENEKSGRYFALGFPNVQANIDTNFYNSAVGERLVGAECPRDLAEVEGQSYFLAGKSVGSAVLDNLADFQAAVFITDNNLNDASGPFTYEVHAGLGIQITEETKVYTATAAGYVDSTAVDPAQSSLWTINQDKKLTNFRAGY